MSSPTLARIVNRKPYPCRWPGCNKPSSHYARDNRATYGHLCTAHFLSLDGGRADGEQMFYAGDPAVGGHG